MKTNISCTLCVLSLVAMSTLATISPLNYYYTPYKDQLKLAFVGDLLLHRPLVVQAKKKGFLSLWKSVLPLLKTADIAVVNLEGPIASQVNRHGRLMPKLNNWDPPISTSYPRFNYPPALAYALQQSHFRIATTANNHAFDRFQIGVNKTIGILKQHHIIPLGSKRTRQQGQHWYKITRQNGIKLAWIACTDSLNGLKDPHHQVLRCQTKWGKQRILSDIRQLKHSVDAIIVLPHWGQEYQQRPNGAQRRFAKHVLNAGASLVIGTHPHVLQPFQRVTTLDKRRAFIAYSLGNFVSNQGTPTNRASVVLLVGLTKRHGHTLISSIRYQPTYMQNRRGPNNITLQTLGPEHQRRFAWRFIKKTIFKHNKHRA